LKNLTCANEGCVALGYTIVNENRVCVRFSEEIVGSVVEGRRWKAAVCDNEFDRPKHIEYKASSVVCDWGGGRCDGGGRRVDRVGVAHPAKKGVEIWWCDVTFNFFGSIGIKISCVDVGFLGRVIRVRRESVKKFLEVTFVRENTHASQMDCIIVERGLQRPCNRLVQER